MLTSVLLVLERGWLGKDTRDRGRCVSVQDA
jgi:hypothetical protein